MMVRYALRSAVGFAFGALAFGVLATSAPAQEATHGWTGIYAGIQGGGGVGATSAVTTCDDPASVFDNSFNCADSIASGALPTEFSSNFDGALGGATLGYNSQMGQWVFGIEADISKSGLSSSDVQAPGTLVFGTYHEAVGVVQDLDSLTTLRGRIGYATGDVLLFATGGLAAGAVNSGYLLLEHPSGYSAIDARSHHAVGWSIGGGAELAFGTWSLKGEVIHYDLGNDKLSAEFEDPSFSPAGPIFNTKVETSGNIARLGLNYHFE